MKIISLNYCRLGSILGIPPMENLAKKMTCDLEEAIQVNLFGI